MKENPHVDVHRIIEGKTYNKNKQLPKDCQLTTAKRKYPMGDKLYESIAPKP